MPHVAHAVRCLSVHKLELQSAIISLDFHPSGDIIAMASGKDLHL